jgi:hypothetical protein
MLLFFTLCDKEHLAETRAGLDRHGGMSLFRDHLCQLQKKKEHTNKDKINRQLSSVIFAFPSWGFFPQ